MMDQAVILVAEPDPDEMQEIQAAMDMLEAGCDDRPTLEIVPQTTVIRRRGREMVEETEAAFVKISTGFKAELKDIDATALKVWLFLALSINRHTEQAHPGIRTIAAACGMGQNTALTAIKELERLGLLEVNREDRKYNIYEIPGYVSANRKTASVMEADDKTASEKSQTASENGQTASVTGRHNQRNQSKPDSPGKPQKRGDLLDGYIALNMAHKEQQDAIDAMCTRFERSLKVKPDFGRPAWEAVVKELIRNDAAGQPIEDYAAWAREHPYDAPKVAQIANNPRIVTATWLAAFSDDAPREAVGAAYQPFVAPDRSKCVPPPERKPK